MTHPTSGSDRSPRVVVSRAELRDALTDWLLHPTPAPTPTPGPDVHVDEGGPGAGAPRRVVVMTMGALHAGHLELARTARRLAGTAGQVVVTVFVNPLQFGAGEDLDRYPRDLDGDVRRLATVGVDVVFAPTPDVVYPDGDPLVRVSAGPLGDVLEGESRPGHFDGVLTVVLKLVHLTRPDVAVFGEKDAQQLLAVRRMVLDLDLDVEVVGVPIVRDADGLALSSRNAYLSAADRGGALALGAALRAGAAAAERGGSVADVLSAARTVLAVRPDVEVDYLTLVDASTVAPLTSEATGRGLLLVAAQVGGTRLIDNLAVEILPAAGGTS